MADFFTGFIFGLFITIEFWCWAEAHREELEKFKMKVKKWMHQQP